MTANERLHAAGVLDSFELLVQRRDREAMIRILTSVGLGKEARIIADTILESPAKYGF